MATIELSVRLETIICCSCGVQFAVPEDLKKNLKQTHREFYCPNGHNQWYSGETEAEKLQKELRRKEQELSDVVMEKLKIQKDFMRLKKGTCPCCKRSFQNLKNHIKHKHPELINDKK